MITVAICEDSSDFRHNIEGIICEKFNFNILTFSNGEALLNAFNNDNILADIYLMDIELPGINGYDTASKIKEKNNKAIIIFLTGYNDYVFQAYEIEAFRYISKLQVKEKLVEALEMAVKKIEADIKEHKYIVTKGYSKSIVRKVYINDIVFFEKVHRYIEIKLVNGETVIDTRSVKEILREINDDRFVFAKKGIVINVNYILGFDKEIAIMFGNVEQHITRDNIKEVRLKTLQNW